MPSSGPSQIGHDLRLRFLLVIRQAALEFYLSIFGFAARRLLTGGTAKKAANDLLVRISSTIDLRSSISDLRPHESEPRIMSKDSLLEIAHHRESVFSFLMSSCGMKVIATLQLLTILA